MSIAINALQVELQEVVGNDAAIEVGEIHAKIFHRFRVEFHHLQVVPGIEKKPGEHPHAGTHLKERSGCVASHSVGNALRHREVGEEVLPERFFSLNLLHLSRDNDDYKCKITHNP